RRLYQRDARHFVRNVRGDRLRLTTLGADQLDGALQCAFQERVVPLAVGARCAHDLGALLGEQFGDGLPDTTAGTGDDRNLVVEDAHRFISDPATAGARSPCGAPRMVLRRRALCAPSAPSTAAAAL